MKNLFKTEGELYYYDKNIRDTQWLLLNCDNSILEYYQHWFKKHYWLDKIQKPKHGSHISVIRGEIIDDVLYHKFWKMYHGQKIELTYSNEIKSNGDYFWLPVQSNMLENIRLELGLSKLPEFNFHLTLGRLREIDK